MSFFALGLGGRRQGIRFPIGGDGGIYDPRINAYTTLGPHCGLRPGQSSWRAGQFDLGVERECLVSILFTN